ncbi:M20/M25/M40 family metallo-hydrolase [Agrobacterium vitis]|nr:M20/M25/M40 family metallo-hydrolase [Agrobacterium vitis]NSZ55480.1 M20/M25/M40 family metallo-hydrolase [Agrobacterium vitis]NTA34546.1 M20/M25/M40 family metallo-hydrolase [Agrobacterium vitis]
MALQSLRRDLHRHPELSGEEEQTAKRVCESVAPTKPDKIITGLGGHGVAVVYDSGVPGPTIMFRSELDALPIQEAGLVEHRSLTAGKAHLCGHDGHSTILVGFAQVLAKRRPQIGRVVLMFQPSEDNGRGAAAVIAGSMRTCGAVMRHGPFLCARDCRSTCRDTIAGRSSVGSRRGSACGFAAKDARRSGSIASVAFWRSAC